MFWLLICVVIVASYKMTVITLSQHGVILPSHYTRPALWFYNYISPIDRLSSFSSISNF